MVEGGTLPVGQSLAGLDYTLGMKGRQTNRRAKDQRPHFQLWITGRSYEDGSLHE